MIFVISTTLTDIPKSSRKASIGNETISIQPLYPVVMGLLMSRSEVRYITVTMLHDGHTLIDIHGTQLQFTTFITICFSFISTRVYLAERVYNALCSSDGVI